MSKGRGQVLARVSLPRSLQGGFHTQTAIGALRPVRRAGARQPIHNDRKWRHMTWLCIPKLAERRGQRVADDRGDVRRADEPAGPCGPVRRRDAEALVGQQHDAHVRRVLRDAHRVVPVGVQDGLRHSDRPSGAGIFGTKGFFGTCLGEPGSVLSHAARGGPGAHPVDHRQARRSTSRSPRSSTSSSCSRRSRRSWRSARCSGASTSRRGSRTCCCGSRSCTRSTRS